MQKLIFIPMNELTPIFDSNELEKFCRVLNRKFAEFLNQESFEIEAGFKQNQIQIKMTLKNHDEMFFYPIEAIFVQDDVFTIDKEFMNKIAATILDYLEAYFDEFLSEGRDVYIPIDWSVHKLDELTFFLRGFTRNLKIEKIADEFLSKHGHGDLSILPISSEY